MDLVARYLNRGRWLDKLDDLTLQQAWIISLKRAYLEGSRTSATGDVYAELALRGIEHVELPQDLAEAIYREIEMSWQALLNSPRLLREFFDSINQFGKSLGPSNN